MSNPTKSYNVIAVENEKINEKPLLTLMSIFPGLSPIDKNGNDIKKKQDFAAAGYAFVRPPDQVKENKMKMTKQDLKRIIKEELQKVLKEGLDYEKITGMTLKKGYIEMGGDETEGTLEIDIQYIGPDAETYEETQKEFSVTLNERELKTFNKDSLSKELGDRLNSYDEAITGGPTNNVADLFSAFFQQKPDILNQILPAYRQYFSS